LIKGIAFSRKLSEDQVKQFVDIGPLIASEATKSNLIDEIKYFDQLEEDTKSAVGNSAKIVPFMNYLSYVQNEEKLMSSKAGKVALIYCVGNIGRELPRKSGITPHGMKKAFEEALKDKSVSSIVIRMDSPGGDALASDTIWRYIQQAQEKGIKIVASIGDVAASGGYYIISSCDRIVAQPGSITGSIGVVGGKFIVSQFLEKKLGITQDDVTIGNNANLESPFHDFTPSQWDHFHKHINDTYERFVSKVSEGRKIPIEQVKEVGGGKVYTGEMAKSIGLVDEIGGLSRAIELAKELIDDKEARVQIFPRKLNIWEQIVEQINQFNGDSDIPTLKASLLDIFYNEDLVSYPILSAIKPLISSVLSQKQIIELKIEDEIPKIDKESPKKY